MYERQSKETKKAEFYKETKKAEFYKEQKSREMGRKGRTKIRVYFSLFK